MVSVGVVIVWRDGATTISEQAKSNQGKKKQHIQVKNDLLYAKVGQIYLFIFLLKSSSYFEYNILQIYVFINISTRF